METTDARLLRDVFGPEAVSDDTRAMNAKLDATLAMRPEPADLAAAREAYASGHNGIPASPKSPRARTTTIAGPAGEIALRILAPDVVRGVYLYIHGGGWGVGVNDMWDDGLEQVGREAGLACVSVDYRLAPEHVFPAAVDDCVAAALWLVDHAEADFGTSCLAIGGESAGAHLAAATLIRLRDAGRAKTFRATNLTYGCFDLSLTPSMRLAKGTPFVDRPVIEAMVAAFRGDADLRDPALSPLYADLRDMPPALFSVGTIDPLLDDSLFMHMRWKAAGNTSELAVFPGGVHGFNLLDGIIAKEANHRANLFLRSQLEAAAGERSSYQLRLA